MRLKREVLETSNIMAWRVALHNAYAHSIITRIQAVRLNGRILVSRRMIGASSGMDGGCTLKRSQA
jgi:hypothetical protein